VGTADDSEIDPDSAVRLLEHLVQDLNSAESGEREYLKAMMRQEIGSMHEGRTAEQSARAAFYLDLMEALDDKT
jgi:hypothetical protein